MIGAVSQYLSTLSKNCGETWNSFWFQPADPLPLSLIRLLTGGVTLYWYLTLAPDLDQFFGSGGLLPVETVRQLEGSFASSEWSYFNHLSNRSELWTAYWLGAAVILAFFVGCFTRLAAPLTLIVVLATIHRAPPITGQVEPVLAMALFYLALGPSGARLSLDAWRAARRAPNGATRPAPINRSTIWTGVVTRAFQVHLAMFYATMGLSKLYSEQWWGGVGTWWLLTRSESRLVDLTLLHRHPYVINFWSHATVVVELAMATLIWVRVARPLLLVLSAVTLTLLTLVTGQVTFLLMMLIANLIFLPSELLEETCMISGHSLRETDPASSAR